MLRYRENTATMSITEVAQEVIAGKWGNGSDRMPVTGTVKQVRIGYICGQRPGKAMILSPL